MPSLMRSDERLQRLGEDLLAARRAGEPFSRAWARARRTVLAGLPSPEQEIYRGALSWSVAAWHDAYNSAPPSPREQAISELREYAVDGELERLSAS
jgi:hypothetical protein